MSPQQKQSAAAFKYRAAKKEAQCAAKIAAKQRYNEVYTEKVKAAYEEYMTSVRVKADTVPQNTPDCGITRENLDMFLADMEPEEDDNLT